MSNEKKQIEIESATDWFYKRVKILREYLPKPQNEVVFNALGPEYDSYTGTKQIHNVLNYRTTDMKVLDAMERIVWMKSGVSIDPKNNVTKLSDL